MSSRIVGRFDIFTSEDPDQGIGRGSRSQANQASVSSTTADPATGDTLVPRRVHRCQASRRAVVPSSARRRRSVSETVRPKSLRVYRARSTEDMAGGLPEVHPGGVAVVLVGSIGRSGAVQLSAWICGFSYIANAAAASGVHVQPDRSRIFSTRSGSVL
jgi:hypothetical protein